MAANTSEHTESKQVEFAKIISLHIKIVKKVWDKHRFYRPNYLYLDLYAGPGYYNDQYYDGPGSPVIALRAFSDGRIGHEAHLFNNDESECYHLRASIGQLANIHIGDNTQMLDRLNDDHNRLGLAYLDPNNVLPDFEMARRVQDKFKRLDLLFYFGAAFDKRVRCAQHLPLGEGHSLLEKMRLIEKEKWIVKEPIGRQQYTFLLATNCKIGDWKKEGWHDVESDSGWEILNRLNYTDTELFYSNQMRLV